MIGSEIEPDTSGAGAQTQPAADIIESLDVPPQTPQEPNLRIQVEGNRRWCVRMREPIWPSTHVRRPQGRRARRALAVNTLAYTYYVYAEAEEEAEAGEDAEAEEEEIENESDPPAIPGAKTPHLRPALREEGGVPPGSFLISESSIFRPLKNQRRPKHQRQRTPPKQGELLVTWDNSRSCSTFPSFIEASLPPGRYALQANFDVLRKGHGWRHSHIARLEGVEIEAGRVTEVSMQVSTDGYVEVKPQGRVAIFLPRTTRASQAPSPGEDELSSPLDEEATEAAPATTDDPPPPGDD